MNLRHQVLICAVRGWRTCTVALLRRLLKPAGVVRTKELDDHVERLLIQCPRWLTYLEVSEEIINPACDVALYGYISDCPDLGDLVSITTSYVIRNDRFYFVIESADLVIQSFSFFFDNWEPSPNPCQDVFAERRIHVLSRSFSEAQFHEEIKKRRSQERDPALPEVTHHPLG